MTYSDNEKRTFLYRAINEFGSIHGASERGEGFPSSRTMYGWQKELNIEEPKNKESVVLVIPDLHCPFHHPDSLAFLRAVKKRFLPSKIVCLGDEVDFHAFSKYPKDPDGMSAGHELQAAIDALMPFYLEFPEVMVCESNHTKRPINKMFESGIPKAMRAEYASILKAPDGWVWQEEWIIDNVSYIHGDPFGGENAHKKWMSKKHRSVVIGHIHVHAGVFYHGTKFAMNTGCLIGLDKDLYPFKYASKMSPDPSIGCGIVINGKAAHFLPMVLGEDNRWVGKL